MSLNVQEVGVRERGRALVRQNGRAYGVEPGTPCAAGCGRTAGSRALFRFGHRKADGVRIEWEVPMWCSAECRAAKKEVR